MCRLPVPGDSVTLDAERAEDDAEGKPERLEDGPLLDVQLEIGGCGFELGPSVERRIEIDTVRRERVGQRDAVAVDELPKLVLVGHRSRCCARAEEAAAEACAFLVGPVHEPDRDRRLSLARDPTQHLDARDDVEAPVEPAAVRDRVDVSADEDGALRLSGQREPLVPSRVDRLLRGGARDEVTEPLARTFPRLRPRHALRPVLVSGELPELLQLGDGSLRIECHGGSLVRGFAWDALPWVVTDCEKCPPGSRQARGDVFLLVLGSLWALWEGYKWLWVEHRLDVAVRCRRSDRCPHLHSILAAARGSRHPTGDDLWLVPPLERRSSQRSPRPSASRSAPSSDSSLGVVLAHFDVLQARSHAVRRRVADDSDPCAGTDPRSRPRKRFDQRFASGGLGARVRDRRLPHVLPGHGQHRSEACARRIPGRAS